MSGIDPYAYMQQVSMQMHDLKSRSDMQDSAEQLITMLREKLVNAG